jgi:hypothetical protein
VDGDQELEGVELGLLPYLWRPLFKTRGKHIHIERPHQLLAPFIRSFTFLLLLLVILGGGRCCCFIDQFFDYSSNSRVSPTGLGHPKLLDLVRDRIEVVNVECRLLDFVEDTQCLDQREP